MPFMTKLRTFAILTIGMSLFGIGAAAQECRHIGNPSDLKGYEAGPTYTLRHFKFTNDRAELRKFLWEHWRNHRKGLVTANVETVDRGTVKVLYIVQPDPTGAWGVDVELDRPLDPPCITFRVDLLTRLPLEKNAPDYPDQTLGFWPPPKLPARRVPDSENRGPKLYRLALVSGGKPISDPI